MVMTAKPIPPDIPLNEPPLIDLRNYDLSNFNLGKPPWYVMLW